MKKFRNTNYHPERSEGSKRKDSSLTLRMTKGRIYLTILLALLCAAVAGLGIALLDFKPATRGTDGVLDGNKTVSAAGAVGNVSAGHNTIYSKEVRLKGTNQQMQDAWNEAITASSATDNVLVILENNWTASSSSITDGFGSGVGFFALNPPANSGAGDLWIPAGKKITVDLNGHTIDRNVKDNASADNSVIEVSGELIICDSSGENSGKITGGHAKYDGGGIYVDTTGKLTLNSGTICFNQANTRTLTSASQVSSYNGGGGVMVMSGEFIMNGGVISNNECFIPTIGSGSSLRYDNPHGGGVAINSGGNFTMNGGLITENTASFGGGIAVTNSGSTMKITGGTIHKNYAEEDGGAGIYTWDETGLVEIDNCVISENEARDANGGGGLLISGDCPAKITNCKIINNKAVKTARTPTLYNHFINGGGIIFHGSKAGISSEVRNCIISGNSSDNHGGGIAIWNVQAGTASVNFINIVDCTITDNTAANNGGGVWYGVYGGTNNVTATTSANTAIPALENTVITGNSAGGYGGGIFLSSARQFGIKGGVMVVDNGGENVYFMNNTARLVCQGLLYGGGVATHIGVTYASNITGTTTIQLTKNYASSGNVTDTEYLFSDNKSYMVSWNSSNDKILKVKGSGIDNTTPIEWEYEIDGVWQTLPGEGYYKRTYDGKTITGVRASYAGAVCNSTTDNTFLYVTNSDGSTSFNGLKNVGRVGFVIDGCAAGTFPNADAPRYCFTIEVVPADVEVEIDDKTSIYGDAFETLTSDADPDLGVSLEKDYGYGVGKYAIKGKSWTNKNYNVTFVNNGIYTVTQRNVTVILNEAQFAYGADSIAVNQKLNNTANADGKYIGGWRYGAGSKEFISADLTATRSPFTLSSSAEYTAAQSAASGFAYPVVGSVNTIAASNINPNYNITFKRDNDTSGATTGKLSIVNAKITVDPDATHGKSTVYELKDVGSGKILEIPAANIKIKGDQTATKTITYADYVFASTDENATAPTMLPKLDASVTPAVYKWQDGVWNGTDLTNTAISSWIGTAGATALTRTAAGTYKAIFKISVPNHEDLIIDWTLVINSKSVAVTIRAEKKDNSGSWATLGGHATYGDTVRASVNLDAITDPDVDKTKLTNYVIYYKGTTDGKAYPDVTGVTFDGDGFNSDKTIHNVHGATVAPVNAGSYTATLVPKAGDYNITAGSLTCAIVIDKKKVSKTPADAATIAKTYTAAEQTFNIKDFDFDVFNLGTLPTGITDKNGTFTNKTASSRQLQATNAGEYKVPFALKDTANYEWDSSVTVNASKQYELKLTIKQAPLTVKFKSPAENATPAGAAKWLWKPDTYAAGSYITYEIDQTKIMPATGTKEAVTVELLWCVKPEAGNAAVSDTQHVDSTGLDISSFTKGNYYVYVKLEDESTNSVNANYIIAVDATSKLPDTCKQEFEVTDGSASLSGVAWNYKYTYNGSNEEFALSGATIEYRLNNANHGGNAVEYTVLIDGATLPEYMEVDVNYAVSGFAANTGYKDAKQTNAGTNYKTTVALKIKSTDASGNPYTIVFDKNDTTTGYKWISDKACEYTVTWSIAKGKIDTDALTWEYSINSGTTWNDVPADNNIGYNEGDDIYVRIKKSSYEGSGLAEGDISYGGTDEGFNKGSYTTLATISPSNVNLETPSAPVELQWNITNAQITVTGWNANGTLTKNGKALDTPTAKIDDATLSQYIKYVYTCTLPDGNQYSGEGFDALEYLNDIAKQNNAKILVTVKAESNSGDYDVSGTNLTQSFTVGEQKKYVDVTVTGDGSIYGDVTLSVTVKYNGNDFAKKNYTILLYGKGADLDNLDTPAKELKPDELNDPVNYRDVLSDAGRYVVVVKLTDEARQSKFTIETPAVYFTIEPKEIEVPEITGEIVFNSEMQSLADYLDGKYKQYLDAGIISPVGGMYEARDAKSAPYSATIEIINSNYKWKYPAAGGATPSKTLLKATLTDGAADYGISGTDTLATYEWKVTPYKLDNSYVSTSNGQFMTNKLPQWAQELIANETLTAGVRYYTDSACLEEAEKDEEGNYVLSAGKTYYGKPVISGEDACNFTFATDGTVTNTSDKAVTYKVPQKGMTAALNSIKGFATKTLLGLPVWMWLLIALAVLLFLIIIILVARRRRKNKEAREEKKAAKQAAKEEAQAKAEAEKERREAEKQRLQEQREAEKARLESQREIEKMRAEAEIAKIKAQAQQSVIPSDSRGIPPMPAPQYMQQPPAQPPFPQQAMHPQMQPQAMPPAQPPYPQQATPPQMQQSYVDNGILARIEAELAAIRAAQQSGGSAPQNTDALFRISELKSELASMRAEQRASDRAEHKAEQEAATARMEAEISRLRSDLGLGYAMRTAGTKAADAPALSAAQSAGMTINAETFGAMMAAMLRNMANPAAPEKPHEPLTVEMPQVIEAETAPVTQPAVYPPDAVTTTTTTTTTTVDTTKDTVKDTARRDENGFFDIDGFYDKYEGNK